MSSTPQLTDQQEAAVHARDVSVALSASAGCGKTFVLTQRFLTHLRRNVQAGGFASGRDPLSGLIAITFTERAAREMRDRIRGACHSELARCPDAEVEQWMQVLRGLDSARISTIHSFCAALLRTHAVDAEIDPQFGLLEEATGSTFLNNVVRATLFDLLAAGDDDSLGFVMHYGLERSMTLLRTLVLGRFHVDFARFESISSTDQSEQWLSRWRDEFVPQLLQEFSDSPTSQMLLDLLATHKPDHPTMQQRCADLAANLAAFLDSDDPLATVTQMRLAARVQGGGGSSVWQDDAVYDQIKHHFEQFRKDAAKLITILDVDESDVETASRFGLMAFRMTQKIASRYESRKREAGLLDFDDLLTKSHNLLNSSESVRRRAASGIDYLMVDEFQDTDPVQSEIVRYLCGAELQTGKLFLVGDVKQSVYRFRRADPRVFSALRDEMPERGRLPLSTNFRSQPAILNFVNALFAPVMGDDYEPLFPFDKRQHSPTPAIEFLFAAADAGDESAAQENADGRRRREADWIARRIAAYLQDSTPRIRSKNSETGEVELRPAQAGDVAVLFRTLSNVPLYEEALRRYGLPYYLVGGRTFYAQQEVFDLINLCRFIDDSDDEVSLVGVLRSPFFSLSDDTLMAMSSAASNMQDSLYESPASFLSEQQQRQWRYASEVLGELRAKKDRLPLAPLLNLAVERTGYDAALLNEFLGERKLANLKKLIDMARQFDRSGLYTITDFVERMRESLAEESREELAATQTEGGDVIRLMTIHQSKGLEFPVVFLADMDWSMRGGQQSAHFHPEFGPLFALPKNQGEAVGHLGKTMHKLLEEPEEEAEDDRLLYVATTRAADYLVLSAGLNPSRKTTSSWLRLIAARFDLETGLPVGDPYLGKLSLKNVHSKEIPEINVHRAPPELPRPVDIDESSRLPLEQFRELVEATEPAPLPESLAVIPPQRTALKRFSVSQIEQAATGEAQSQSTEGRSNRSHATSVSPSSQRSAEDATALGTVVHMVLERIDFDQPDDIQKLVERCVRGEVPDQGERLLAPAIQRVRAFIDSPVADDIRRAQRCYREIDFLLNWPLKSATSTIKHGATIGGQVDCLYQSRDDLWHVVDYKTGRVGSAGAAPLIDRHGVQLALYTFAVRDWLGALPDSVSLVLLGEDVTRLPVKLTETFLGEMTTRVDAGIHALRGSGAASA